MERRRIDRAASALGTPGSVRDDEEVAALQHATGTSSLHVDALALYAKGRYLWQARTCPSLERALAYFQRAFSRVQRFARACAAIADVHILEREYLIRNPSAAFADAHAALRRAFEIDPALPEALAARAGGSHSWARFSAAVMRRFRISTCS